MSYGRFLASAVILVLLSGCMTSRVSDDYYVQAETGAISPSDIQGVVPLGPGDVLYLRRALLGVASSTSRTGDEAAASLERFPLRRIGQEPSCGAGSQSEGRMYAYERELLTRVLEANRISGPASGAQDEASPPLPGAEDEIRQNEIALWNCLVENLSVRSAPAGDTGDTGGALRLRVDMDGVLRAFASDSPARSAFRTRVQELSFDSQADTQSSEQNEAALPPFELVTVGFNEVSIQNARWPERQWTLLEWDRSGVLTDRNDEESRLLVLRFTRGGDRFYVAECFGLDPTHHVEVALQDQRPTRDLIRTHTGLQGWFKTLYQGAALPQSDLDELVVANVHAVEVGTGDRCGVQ